MSLSLDTIAKNPKKYAYEIDVPSGEKLIIRPLEKEDEEKLAQLFKNLSENTKNFYTSEEPFETRAKEHIDAINKYDKLRFVLEKTDLNEIIGLFEFSFDIPPNDISRFENYAIKLTSNTDCRIGPLLKDEYQSKGFGSLVLPAILNIAKQFNKKRVILWGGVNKNNAKAIRFYEKNGFKNLGSFINQNKIECYDMLLNL